MLVQQWKWETNIASRSDQFKVEKAVVRAMTLRETGGTVMQICGQHEFLRSSAFGRGSLGLAQHAEQPSKALQGKEIWQRVWPNRWELIVAFVSVVKSWWGSKKMKGCYSV